MVKNTDGGSWTSEAAENTVTGALITGMDWSTTPVGAIETWPISLKNLVRILLHSRHPMFLWWGPELTQFYNDAYLPSFGKGKHPGAMGQRGRECWGEIWPIIGPQIEEVMATGTPTWHEDALVPILRNGRIEEVFWTYGYSPAFGDDGSIAGTLVVCTETTTGVLANRRLSASARLAALVGLAEASEDVLLDALKCFAEFDSDIPFAAVITALQVTHSTPISNAAKLLLRDQAEELTASEQPTRYALSVPVVAGPWPEPVTDVYVIPLGPRFVVFGVSSRLPLDGAYQKFLAQLIDGLRAAKARLEAIVKRATVEGERRNLLMQAPVAAALLIGPEHRFELANPTYIRMVGREVQGKAYLEAFPEVVGTELVEILRRAYQEGRAFATEEMRVPFDHDGTGKSEDLYFKFNLEPIRHARGEVYGMMVVAVEITEIVRARDAHAQLVERLEAADRAKDEFLAMLGHELRNPLAPIVTALDLARLHGDGELSVEDQMIDRQVQHLIRLVDDLMDVARIARGKVKLKKAATDIESVASKAIEIAEPLLDARRHNLTVDIPEPIQWWGDATRLAQVIANLLTNAARYSEPGGDVSLEAILEDESVVITVRDKGRGIAPDMIGRIFDLFAQGPATADRADGGLGLGLSLVRNLVTLHGGTVTASSEGLGRGSTFIVRLPVGSPRMKTVPAETSTSSIPRRILVVDDNADAAEALAQLLGVLGHSVEVSLDPITALEKFDEMQPEVALIDIGLPILDGYELARRVLALEGLKPCRLIAVTGYGQRSHRERSAEAGFFAHLVKPIQIDELTRLIQVDPAAD